MVLPCVAVAGMDVEEAIELIKSERPDLKNVVKVYEVGGTSSARLWNVRKGVLCMLLLVLCTLVPVSFIVGHPF